MFNSFSPFQTFHREAATNKNRANYRPENDYFQPRFAGDSETASPKESQVFVISHWDNLPEDDSDFSEMTRPEGIEEEEVNNVSDKEESEKDLLSKQLPTSPAKNGSPRVRQFVAQLKSDAAVEKELNQPAPSFAAVAQQRTNGGMPNLRPQTVVNSNNVVLPVSPAPRVIVNGNHTTEGNNAKEPPSETSPPEAIVVEVAKQLSDKVEEINVIEASEPLNVDKENDENDHETKGPVWILPPEDKGPRKRKKNKKKNKNNKTTDDSTVTETVATDDKPVEINEGI